MKSDKQEKTALTPERLALLGHDLRTPLTAMKLTVEMLEREGGLSSSQQGFVEILSAAVDTLDAMAGELFQGMDEEHNEHDRIDLTQVVNDTAALFAPVAKEKGLQFSFEKTIGPLCLKELDTVRFRRILSVLIDNAIKYTAKGKVVIFGPELSAQGSGYICVRVMDTGPGIEASERERLFKPFERGLHSADVCEGSGLGLWGANQLVGELGGSLIYSSASTGGSCFEIRLPLHIGDEKGEGYGPLDATKPCVLVVDDNETNRQLVGTVLNSFGVECHLAFDGLQAIALFQENAYDGVLLDLNMPGMNGVEIARTLYEHESGKARHVPLIAFTAAYETVDIPMLEHTGFSRVLSKPLSPAELYDALEGVRARYAERISMRQNTS